MNRVQAGVLALLVVLVLAPIAASPTDGGTSGSSPSVATIVEADEVEFRITVFENGSARWTFRYTRLLENESERREFEAFARTFEENETDAYRDFRTQARALAESGRNATGRQMRAADFSRSAGLGGACVTTQDCGTVQMSFTWTAFAAQDGERLVVGDVFGTGLFISSDQQLVFETGPNTSFGSASPDTYGPSDTRLAELDSITYTGEQRFSDRRPKVVFVPGDGAAGTSPGSSDDSPTGGSGDTPSTPTGDGAGGFPMALVGGLLVVVVGAGAAYVWWRGDGTGALPVGGVGGDGGAAAERPADVAAEPAVPEEELLTDEDRVTKLLEENGGRMKQVDIVDETGWSKSKVSMLLSDMEDDDQISKLRVGRENIISLAGHEPEAAGSPHDED